MRVLRGSMLKFDNAYFGIASIAVQFWKYTCLRTTSGSAL